MAAAPPNAGKGRPKGATNRASRELKALAQEHTALAVRTLANIMRRPKAPAAAQVHAAEVMLAYGHGKPRQGVDVQGKLTLEQLVAASFANPDADA